MDQSITQFRGEFNYLSNFHTVKEGVEYNGRTYPTSEHAFMSAKSEDPEWKKVCLDPTIPPAEIKKRGYKVALAPNWDNIKNGVMLEVLRSKFSHESYKRRLLSTGDAMIYEGNTWNDRYWGVDLNTLEGQNVLGRTIMLIRDELRDGVERKPVNQ